MGEVKMGRKKRKLEGRERKYGIHPRNKYADNPPDFQLLGSKYPSRKYGMHPRNKYADNPPDFQLLGSKYPSFSYFLYYSPPHKRPRIDWTDFNATRELTRVLLHHHHSLNWWIPDGQLCPTVPNRSNYIHWVEDLLASDIIEKQNAADAKVRGFDIGTGANCIYPLLGASLLGWNFVGSDFTDVALEWAVKNVKSNPHISDLIEIRKVCVADSLNGVDSSVTSRTEDNGQPKAVQDSFGSQMKPLDDPKSIDFCGNFGSGPSSNSEEVIDITETRNEEIGPQPSTSDTGHLNVNKGYNGPPILLGVVKEGESFDFCMCNPPFFESMEEAGLNPKTSCGGTPEEMVCQGGEQAFIGRIIEDSVTLKQSFRWYTSMVGKKSNLKYLTSKLREVGVTIVKTTEFVQGQTCRWGLAWSFMPPAKKLVLPHAVPRSNLSFMLEGLQRQISAFHILQTVESFFTSFGASCKINPSSFSVDVNVSKGQCEVILKTDVKKHMEGSCFGSVAQTSNDASCQDDLMNTSLCISFFQQIPGTLLVKALLKQRDGPLSGTSCCLFQQLEEYLKHKFCREKALR